MRSYLFLVIVTKSKEAPENELSPRKHTLRLHQPRVPGSEYKVIEIFPGCRINYDGLKAMLRNLDHKSSCLESETDIVEVVARLPAQRYSTRFQTLPAELSLWNKSLNPSLTGLIWIRFLLSGEKTARFDSRITEPN